MVEDRIQLLADRMQNVESAPILWRLNGIGFTLLGALWEEAVQPPLMVRMHWFTFLWIPLIPLAAYIVVPAPGGLHGAYHFLRKLSLHDFHRIYQGRLLKFYGSVIVDSLLFMLAVAFALTVVVTLLWIFKSRRW